MIKNIFLIFNLFLFNLVFSNEPHHTTAYINARQLDLLLTFSHYQTHNFWNRNHTKLNTYNHFQSQSYSLYAEYGINYKNSFTINCAFSTVKENLNGNSHGLNDIELGWKLLLRKQETSALTFQLIEILPIRNKKSSIRYSKAGVQASLLYSDLFYLKNYGWYDLDIGYRYYLGFPSSRINAGAAIGYNIASFTHIITSIRLNYGLFNKKSTLHANNVVFNPNFSLLNAQIECDTKIFSYAWLAIGVFKHIWGVNVGSGGGFFCGAWCTF